MPDISMCPGKGCALKKTCYRYTATPSSYQSYFSVEPKSTENTCDYYWKDHTQVKKVKNLPKEKL